MGGGVSVLVVGGAVAAASMIGQLRADGFTGSITVVDHDPDAPYDRPPLSKEFLSSADLRPEAQWWVDKCELVIGSALGLDVASSTVTMVNVDGQLRRISADHIVLACGSTPVRLPHLPAGVAYLRTAADARQVREQIGAGRRVTILGAGTIGTELASSVSTAGGEATLIDMAAQPLDRFFAGHLGTEAAAWIEAGRVGLHLGTKIEAVTQSGKAWIVTTSHDEVGADLVVSAVGTRPALAWLDNSDLDIANGVLCDPNGTAIDTVGRLIPNVHAIGDASAWTNTDGSVRRREDWTTAQRQGRHVARVLLGQAPVQEFNREPDYFWTHQFGRRIQILGTPQREADLVTQTEAAERNAAFYTLERNGEPVAWISVNAPREFGLAMQRSMSATH